MKQVKKARKTIMTEQSRELLLHQIITELFQLVPPGAVKNALWQRYLDALPLQGDESNPDWRAIEQQATRDLEHIQTDKDATDFIEKYFLKELRHDYLRLYHADRHEMNRTPREAIDNLLSLPPL